MAHCNVSEEHFDYVGNYKCYDCKNCYPTRSKKRCEGYKCKIDKVVVRASADACIFFEMGDNNEKI